MIPMCRYVLNTVMRFRRSNDVVRDLSRHRAHFAAAVLVACAPLLSACDPRPFFMDHDPDIGVKERAKPGQSLLLTMTLANAPGPFALVDGSAQYDVDNRHECGKRNPSTNTVMRITYMADLRWTQVAPAVYQAVVHHDLLLDEDYFGKGVCRWTLMGASALMRATGDPAETRFMPRIFADEIKDGFSKTDFLWSGSYPKAGIDNFPESGHGAPWNIPHDRIGEFFTATIVVTAL